MWAILYYFSATAEDSVQIFLKINENEKSSLTSIHSNLPHPLIHLPFHFFLQAFINANYMAMKIVNKIILSI